LILDPQDHFKYSSVYMGYLQQPLKTSHSSWAGQKLAR
jgi:hypothetical protein